MASTPSASLRLELMATGDQSGTWGTTTNTNLGTLLEQAITGYLSVAQGDVANLTLTTTNYASDQARNAVIRVTGALTATRNVVVQTAAKLYTIANDTTGGFSIVVKTSGGTGVSVPPGAMMNVYSDGTNVVMGQNYWSGSIGGAVYLDAGAAVGPNYDLFRDSTSPAISDILGRVTWNGRDSAGNKQEYGSIEAVIIDPTSTSEDSLLDIYVPVAGTRTRMVSYGPNVMYPTGRSLNWNAGDVTLTHSAGNLALAGSATDVVFDISAANAGQVKFPATQNTSANANTLDDYEEGTWTPVITPAGGAITAYTASGNYTKIGNRTLFDFVYIITNNGTGTGNITVTLPLTSGAAVAATGKETAVAGTSCAFTAGSGATSVLGVTYNNTYPGGTNWSVTASGNMATQ